MGVKTRFPKAFAQKESIVPGFARAGQFWTVWDGQGGLLGQGSTEPEAWGMAYQTIVNREGRCP